MKWSGLLIILAVFVAVSLIFFTAEFSKDFNDLENSTKPQISGFAEPVLNLSVDKEIYYSSEEMKLSIRASLPQEENVTIKIYGIPDGRGNYRVSEEREMVIGPEGLNETLTFLMPSCYGCAGVSSGEYEIVMELIRDGEIIGNCSKTVKLEK